MALGWGVVPYGTGDWGSEGAIIPGAGSVALTGQAPRAFKRRYLYNLMQGP
jgi:hypothetical protein